jgi:hypothetical protein
MNWGFISQKTILFIVMAVKSSNLTELFVSIASKPDDIRTVYLMITSPTVLSLANLAGFSCGCPDNLLITLFLPATI